MGLGMVVCEWNDKIRGGLVEGGVKRLKKEGGKDEKMVVY